MTGAAAIGAPEMVLVRYGELALKGKNRGAFEQALVRNIEAATRLIAPVRVERRRGRMAVFGERRVSDVARRLQDVFGIKSLSPAWGCAVAPEAIAELAARVLADALADFPPEGPITFRVASSRAEKRFPLSSMELDRFIAERVLPDHPRLKVRLERPELSLGIDVRPERAYVFVRRLPGPGGLPVSTLGRGMCLLSGGIDSPVAAWLAMKRGCRVAFVSFHSPPYIGERSRKKIRDLVGILARYQPTSRLYVAPFTEVQTTIRDRAPQPYRTVLYRRMMQRIATRLARREKCGALITGESLGQVASQTLENLTCIEAATDLPVLRPLVTFDKEEAIDLARRIGTFEVSTRPEPDCCTVFMPEHPVLRGNLAACEEAEAALEVEVLVDRAVRASEKLEIASDV
ncbi:MAG: tRNA uracil 4-sulfurtransferase ThiI [Planctomycetota bacterium]|jgi:thiamine biosynthesis protein ThiI|nr:tRNA uracil 4-sulfurtransferase ThiI [Planctomycetota bacterium]MDP6761330.1 tRNA uracil 4-sulfurtransferase ThiI [Planctomycetota bacterium]MDP6991041.1 tRNA uracil 4-sulfurtransferase ThiI [Planctomycetota bacterium]